MSWGRSDSLKGNGGEVRTSYDNSEMELVYSLGI